MTRRSGRASRPAAHRLALAALVTLAITGPARLAVGQDEGDPDEDAAGAADTTSAEDSTVARPFLSTDGAVSVFEEALPGEGIEGFWWEYDAAADLERLLDKDRRQQPLERLTDAFGFDLVLPDSIRALRDSVSSVADSIRAATIEFETSFDPKLRTQYTERRDDYELSNELNSPIPLTRRTTLATNLKDTRRYNRSTNKLRDERNLSSTFTFRYSEKVSTTLTATRTQGQQFRGEDLENDNTDTALNGRAQASLTNSLLGDLDFSAGLALSAKDYQTARTTGESGSLRPNWGAKLSRPHPLGTATLDYSGSWSSGNRKETRPESQMQPDSTFQEVDVTVETSDRNRDDKLSFNGTANVLEGWDVRLNAATGRTRVQYIAQTDSIAGRQETRTGRDASARLTLDAEPFSGLEIRSGAGVTERTTEYDLETAKFANTTRQSADAEFRFKAWPGANLTSKITRDHEDRRYRTPQSGTADKRSASLDYKQKVTANVDLTANLFISLDELAYDDTEANTGDRDLLTQRGTVTLRYNPTSILNTSVKMDARETASVNIHRTRSGDNKTDSTYLIAPAYTLRIGSANITGDFTADARYSVFDFDEERNSLTRRFGTKQRWQQAYTPRLSTELLATYEFTDEGSYKTDEELGSRVFSRSREIRRFSVDSIVQYSPRDWLRSRVLYRQSGDDSFRIDDDGERSPAVVSRTHELTASITIKRKLFRTVRMDLNVTRTEKVGDRVTATDRRYLEIRALIEYQPFKTGEGN